MTEQQPATNTPDGAHATQPNGNGFADMCRQMMQGGMPDWCRAQMQRFAAQAATPETAQAEGEANPSAPATSPCDQP